MFFYTGEFLTNFN